MFRFQALSTFLQHNQDYYSGIENPTNSIIGVVSEEERSVLLRMFETFFEALIKNGDIDLIDKGNPSLTLMTYKNYFFKSLSKTSKTLPMHAKLFINFFYWNVEAV